MTHSFPTRLSSVLAGLSAGRRGAAAGLGLDEVSDGVAAGADHGGRYAHGRGHDAPTDHDDAQVFPLAALLQQHVGAVRAGQLDRILELRLGGHPDGDALPLLATSGLHHELTDLVEQLHVGAVAAGGATARHVEAGRGHDLAGYALVVARSEEHTSELQSLMRISYA